MSIVRRMRAACDKFAQRHRREPHYLLIPSSFRGEVAACDMKTPHAAIKSMNGRFYFGNVLVVFTEPASGLLDIKAVGE